MSVLRAAAGVLALLLAMSGCQRIGEQQAQTGAAPGLPPATVPAARAPTPGAPAASRPAAAASATAAAAPATASRPEADSHASRKMPTTATPGDLEGARLLAERSLVVPVAGIAPARLSDTYAQSRGSRPHEAMDILAPTGSAVVAVDDGRIAKLFTSKPGGLTVYQFDPQARLAYYYAHLDRYAEGLHEGDVVRRGALIGYVGSTGNADPGSPHLHFAVFRLGPERRWWQGEAVNPYPALAVAEPAPATPKALKASPTGSFTAAR